MTSKVKRLFEQFQPQNYNLKIKLDTKNSTFNGTVIITGSKTGKPSKRLTFHQVGLKIDSAEITKLEKKAHNNFEVSRINNQNSFDEVRLHSTQTLYPGFYTIKLAFSGKITPQMNGLYPSTYKTNGDTKHIYATQFESHHAREVFPCIDEPEAKATFELCLHHTPEKAILSNSPVIKTEKISASEISTTFDKTPHMSTYLLAFVIGDLDYLEAKTKNGVVVRTYATPDNIQFTDFALKTAVQCLDFYKEYFDIKYPLAKCDLIALPDFASGAMENWGCITFREQALLVDPKNSALSTKQYVALVVAHELAHQWFGNLVTMRWWTDLWLNEGFASWIEYLAIDSIYPDWKLWVQFAVDEQQQSMKLDGLEHTHPIEVPVNHPDEIRTIFDAISYGKGASVIAMLHQFLGAEDFKNGLRAYLETYKYKNTDTVDLWTSLEEISKKPVKSFMHEWTSTSGFPLVRAEIDNESFKITQERFFSNPAHKKLPAQKWPIPLLTDDENYIDTFDTESFEGKSSDKIIKINTSQNGFYRTVYNASYLNLLGQQVLKGKLSTKDRLGLLNDVFESAKAGYIDTLDALSFLAFYKNETEYPVWDCIASALGSIRLVMNDENLRESMKPFILTLIDDQLNKLGWESKESDSHFDKLLRPIILGLAASADEPEIVKKCKDLFSKIKHTENVSSHLRVPASRGDIKSAIEIDPDLRGVVFGTVARLGGEKEFNKLLALHNSSTLTEEKTTLAAAITGFKHPKLIQESLKIIKTENVRLQDVSYWIAYSLLNRHARKDAWEWVKQNWEWLAKNLGSDLSFYRMPIYVARVYSDISIKNEYTEFFKPKLSPSLLRSYNQGIEMIEMHSAWKNRDFKEIKTYFETIVI